MIGIYKITNPEGKVYIGGSKNVLSRIRNHQTLQKNMSQKMKASFDEFGVDKHLFEIYEACDLKDLQQREHCYIQMFDSVNNGLNTVLPKLTNKL